MDPPGHLWVCPLLCVCLVAQWCLTLCDLMDYSQPGSYVHGDSPGKNTGVDLPNPRIKPRSPTFRRILYHMNYQGSPGVHYYIRPQNPQGAMTIAAFLPLKSDAVSSTD